MNIMANQVDRVYYKHKDAFNSKVISVLESGRYISGNELESFENE